MIILNECPKCQTKKIRPLLDNAYLWPVFKCPVCGGTVEVPFEIKSSPDNLLKGVLDAVKANEQGMYDSAIRLFGIMSHVYLTAGYLTETKLEGEEKELIEKYQAHLTALAYGEVRTVLDMLPSEVEENEKDDWKNALEKFKEAMKQ